jgi:hypothetical protein
MLLTYSHLRTVQKNQRGWGKCDQLMNLSKRVQERSLHYSWSLELYQNKKLLKPMVWISVPQQAVC